MVCACAMLCWLNCLIKLLGYLGLVRFGFEFYLFFFQKFLAKERKGIELRNKYGEDSWAIITGSTDGIGLGFAKYLAAKGFNLVCISRNGEKLARREKEIREYAKETKDLKILNIVKDFAQSYDPAFFDDIREQVKDLDVSMLINNVGVLFEDKVKVLPQTYQQIIDHIVINCCSQVGMFKTIWPQMKARNQSGARAGKDPKKCAVIDLSSPSGKVPFFNFSSINAHNFA